MVFGNQIEDFQDMVCPTNKWAMGLGLDKLWDNWERTAMAYLHILSYIYHFRCVSIRANPYDALTSPITKNHQAISWPSWILMPPWNPSPAELWNSVLLRAFTKQFAKNGCVSQKKTLNKTDGFIRRSSSFGSSWELRSSRIWAPRRFPLLTTCVHENDVLGRFGGIPLRKIMWMCRVWHNLQSGIPIWADPIACLMFSIRVFAFVAAHVVVGQTPVPLKFTSRKRCQNSWWFGCELLSTFGTNKRCVPPFFYLLSWVHVQPKTQDVDL